MALFEKYNEKSRRALFFARYEASKLGSRVIESEHILLGILREGEESIVELLQRLEVKPEDLRREIEGERVFVERISSTAELPLSEESKKILAYASHEAESMVHSAVGSEHLLIGVLRVDGCLAQRVLVQQGLEVAKVREQVAAIARERASRRGKQDLPFLTEFGRDLTALAQQDHFDPLIGRDVRRSAASSRSSRGGRRTTRSCSGRPGWARRPSSRAWRSAWRAAGRRSSSRASGSSRLTCP